MSEQLPGPEGALYELGPFDGWCYRPSYHVALDGGRWREDFSVVVNAKGVDAADREGVARERADALARILANVVLVTKRVSTLRRRYDGTPGLPNNLDGRLLFASIGWDRSRTLPFASWGRNRGGVFEPWPDADPFYKPDKDNTGLVCLGESRRNELEWPYKASWTRVRFGFSLPDEQCELRVRGPVVDEHCTALWERTPALRVWQGLYEAEQDVNRQVRDPGGLTATCAVTPFDVERFIARHDLQVQVVRDCAHCLGV